MLFLEKFSVPDVSRVPFFPLVTFQYGDTYTAGGERAQQLRALLDKKTPEPTNCFVHFDRICVTNESKRERER